MGTPNPFPTAPPQDLVEEMEESKTTELPPPYSECTATAPPIKPAKKPFPTTETEVRAVLNADKSPESKEVLKIIDIQPMNAYSYLLNTLTEKRTLIDITEPYKTQEIENSGRVPKKWDVIAQPPISLANYRLANYNFNSSTTIPLPHSTRVLDCTTCSGEGAMICSTCRGLRVTRCKDCFGTGKTKMFWSEELQNCTTCTAAGNVNCQNCRSSGSVKCSKCEGYKRFVVYRAVIIQWDCRFYEDYTEREALTSQFLSSSPYWVRLEKVSIGVIHAPLEYTKNCEITIKAHRRLMSVVQSQDQNSKILEIRHRIGEIPVVRVEYTSIKKNVDEVGHFFIYSPDCKVYFPSTKQNALDKCICM